MNTSSATLPGNLFQLHFRSLHGNPGYAVPCDAQGHVDLDALEDDARNDYYFARTLVGHRYSQPVVEALH